MYVIVEYPRITQSPIDLFVNEGGEARFVCQASGDPEPNITWVKVDDRLDGRRSTVRADNSLVITNINIFDEGSKSGATTLLPRYFIIHVLPLIYKLKIKKLCTNNWPASFY